METWWVRRSSKAPVSRSDPKVSVHSSNGRLLVISVDPSALDFVQDFADAYGFKVRHVMKKSVCMSCDVNAAVDPSWMEVFEKNNCSFLTRGPVISKYTGSGGKYSTNDASAETMSFIRRILDDAGIPWQVGELGRIDAGGGGTIASEISLHNLDTVDVGVPVLSMHAPLEVTSKADVFMLYKAVKAFYSSEMDKP